jgi:hypothetical protein
MTTVRRSKAADLCRRSIEAETTTTKNKQQNNHNKQQTNIMKTKLSYSIVCAALLAVSQSPSLLAQETAAPKDEVTVTVGDAVKRLDEVKVGDFVQVDYLVSIAAEVRKPTKEEAKHPLEIMAAAGRAPSDMAPAGGVARQFKVVTTIEALDRRNNTVTVKGPLGRYLTARVADPERLTKVRIGDTVVIVYTEAMAVSLDKTAKKSGE